MKENATRILSSYISELEYDDLPPYTIQRVKEVILDYIGVLIAGCNNGSLLSKKLVELLIHNGGSSDATIIGSSIKVPLINAAFANGITSHVVELDDGHRIARGHPGAAVISAALPVAELLGSNGRELITAIVAGYDIFVRIASAINPSHLNRGYHTTGTCGTLAAAAAAAKLFRLNIEETANALGLAGLQAAGLLEVTIDGQMAKPLHIGKAAQAGVLSAFMAKEGAEGPKTIIEGVKGFINTMSDECDYNLLFNDLNKKYSIDSCYTKLYPSCRHTHSAIDAALSLRDENDLHHLDITNILIKTFPTAVSFAGEIFKPDSPEEAKFSIPYCVCAALVKGKFGFKELERECLYDQSIRSLTDKVSIESDQSLERPNQQIKGAEVFIKLNDGRKLFKRINLPKGEVENPISRNELVEKFTYCTDSYFSDEKRNEIVNEIFNINLINNIDEFIARLC